jgi:hypothetical protein
MSLTARRATMARKRYKAEEIVAKLRQVGPAYSAIDRRLTEP